MLVGRPRNQVANLPQRRKIGARPLEGPALFYLHGRRPGPAAALLLLFTGPIGEDLSFSEDKDGRFVGESGGGEL